MTPDFLRAVLDTLIPGEAAPAEAGLPPLPSGSAVIVDHASYAVQHADVLHAIATQAGGERAFAEAAEAARTSVLRSIEARQPEPFRALLTVLLQDYYETPAVLAAMGWRADPPQPRGHELSPAETTPLAAPARAN
jgi:hypothetical protein